MPRPFRKLLSTILLLPALLLPPAAAHDIDIVSLVQENNAAVISVRGVAFAGSAPRNRVPFSEFFPFPPDLLERLQPRSRQPATSTGSGFIIGADGYILTNAHVIKGMDKLIVTLKDGSEFEAEVVGSDEKTDIALLKIESAQPLPTVKIGDSDALQVGEPVLAIGSPYGLDQTVTSGIISALGRRLPSEDYVPFIQTDAAVNPGNSGGPLMNARGDVIGINSQIISPVRSFSGVSFAIPINVAISIQEKLRAHGVVRRGRLGVFFAPVTQNIADAYGLADTSGALIQDVAENSPAEAAGLQSGDVLLTFAGKPIKDAAALPTLVGNTEPNTEVELGVWRDQQVITLTATLTAMEDSAAPQTLLGMRLEELSEQQARRTGVERGVVVVDIDRSGKAPAGINHIRPGDIITHALVDQRRRAVESRSALAAMLKDIQHDTIALYIWRSGRRLVIPVKVPADDE